MKIFKTNTGLGYGQFAYVVSVQKKELPNTYLVVETDGVFNSDHYKIGSTVELDSHELIDANDFDISNTSIYHTFLFKEYFNLNARINEHIYEYDYSDINSLWNYYLLSSEFNTNIYELWKKYLLKHSISLEDVSTVNIKRHQIDPIGSKPKKEGDSIIFHFNQDPNIKVFPDREIVSIQNLYITHHSELVQIRIDDKLSEVHHLGSFDSVKEVNGFMHFDKFEPDSCLWYNEGFKSLEDFLNHYSEDIDTTIINWTENKY